jgi:O-Antigen ligase
LEIFLERKLHTCLLAVFLGVLVGIGTSVNALITLLLVIGVPVVFLTYAKPFYVFLFILAYMPFERILLSWLPTNIDDIASLLPEMWLFLLISCLFVKYKFKIPKITTTDIFLLVLLSWSILITIVQQVELFNGLMGMRLLFRGLLVYLAIRLIKESPVDILKRFSSMLINITLFEGVFGVLQIIGKKVAPSYWNSFGDNGSMVNSLFGVQGTLGRYDQYGMFLALSGLVLLARYVYFNKDKITLIAISFSLIGVFISTSRQALVLFVIGAFLMLLSHIRKVLNRKITLIFLYFLTLFAILFFWFAPDFNLSGGGRNPFELFTSIFDANTYNAQQNVNFRLYYILNIGPWLIENYFWGMGLGTFGAWFSLEDYRSIYYYLGLKDNFINYIADVNWISVVGQVGVPGTLFILISFILLPVNAFIKSVKDTRYKSLYITVAVITVCFALSGFFGPNFEIKTNAMFFWIFLGLFAKIANTKAN